MPSVDHELISDLFRNRPELAVELLRNPLGIEVPAHQTARVESGDLSEVAPTP